MGFKHYCYVGTYVECTNYIIETTEEKTCKEKPQPENCSIKLNQKVKFCASCGQNLNYITRLTKTIIIDEGELSQLREIASEFAFSQKRQLGPFIDRFIGNKNVPTDGEVILDLSEINISKEIDDFKHLHQQDIKILQARYGAIAIKWGFIRWIA